MLPSMMIVEIVAQRNREMERDAQMNLAIHMANVNLPVHRYSLSCRALAGLGKKLVRFGFVLQHRFGEDYPMQSIPR